MSLWRRQIAGVLRLEMKKTLLSRRAWWVYLLALAPVLLTLAHGWRVRGFHHNLDRDAMGFATLFQLYFLRLGIFFGCLGIFSNLFRGEMLEKTLHYYFLTPVRRGVLVSAKYLAGAATATALFVPSAVLSSLLIGRHFGPAWTEYVLHGPGLSQAARYGLVAALACLGYGAVFLVAGLKFRNPLIPAAVVMVWENLNPFLPSLLKKVSVIFYLKGLCPVDVALPPVFALMVVDADPVPAWIAISGLLAVSALLLAYAASAARRTEIAYGE